MKRKSETSPIVTPSKKKSTSQSSAGDRKKKSIQSSADTELKKVKEVPNSDAASGSVKDDSSSKGSSSSNQSLSIDDSSADKRIPAKKRTMVGDINNTMKRMDTKQSMLSEAGGNGPKSKQRVLTPRSKRLRDAYEEIKYEPDEAMLPWQR